MTVLTMQRVQRLLNGQAKSNYMWLGHWNNGKCCTNSQTIHVWIIYLHERCRMATFKGNVGKYTSLGWYGIERNIFSISGGHIVCDLLETFIAPFHSTYSVWLIQKKTFSKAFVFNSWSQVCWPPLIKQLMVAAYCGKLLGPNNSPPNPFSFCPVTKSFRRLAPKSVCLSKVSSTAWPVNMFKSNHEIFSQSPPPGMQSWQRIWVGIPEPKECFIILVVTGILGGG